MILKPDTIDFLDFSLLLPAPVSVMNQCAPIHSADILPFWAGNFKPENKIQGQTKEDMGTVLLSAQFADRRTVPMSYLGYI